MQISEKKFKMVILSIIVLVILGAVAALLLLPKATLPETDGYKAQIEFSQLQASAEVHKTRLLDYAGVCVDIVMSEGVVCSSAADAYALEKRLESGEYYCADSTGYSGISFVSKGNGTQCQN